MPASPRSLRSHFVVLALSGGLLQTLAVAVLLVVAGPRPIIGIVAVLLVAAWIVLAWAVERRITDSIKAIADAAQDVALGKLAGAAVGRVAVRDLVHLMTAVEASASARRIAEERMRDGEGRLASVIACTTEPIVGVDRARRIVLFSTAAEHVFGCDGAEAIGQLVDRFVSHEVQRVLVEVGSVRPGTVTLRNATAFRVDAREFPAEVTIAAVPAGRDQVWTLVIRDLSGQRRDEAERTELHLRAQQARSAAETATAEAEAAQARFTRLAAALDGIAWEADPTTLAFTFVAQRAEELLGYPVERWLGTPGFWTTILHPDDGAQCLEHLEALVRTGGTHRFEHRAIGANGVSRWMESVVHAVDGEDGMPRLYGVMLDIDQRKRLEERHHHLLAGEQAARAEAEAAARRAKFLAEASQALASSLDYEATLAAVTRLAVPTFADWCLVHLTDTDSQPRLHAAHADPLNARVAHALERLALSGDLTSLLPALGVFQGGASLLLREISPAWLETVRLVQELGPRSVMMVPLVARGRTIGTLTFVWTQPDRHYGDADLALAEDLARRAALAVDNARLYREAERANQAKDEFLATLSHELRTPLTAMLGWVLSLKSNRLGPEQRIRAIDRIERNTRRQTQLINDLLDVSRIAAGKLELDRRPIDLRGVVEAAIEDVRGDAELKKLRLTWSPARMAVPVLGDFGRLEQVAINILANAVKFTPEDGQIDVRLERVGASARITVTDTGQGIKADALPHVFETFRQADSTSTRRHGGLGLGLAIVRHLVELHEGQVEAHSEGPGRGATLVVTLPILAIPITPAASGGTRTVEPTPPALDGIRVLVVDDDAGTREIVETILAERGARVLSAGSAREALEILDATTVDVLLSDIEMPGENGYQLLRRVRERDPARGGRTPAVALTAYAGREDRARALAAGFQCHATKPITPTDLAEVVARAAGRKPGTPPQAEA